MTQGKENNRNPAPEGGFVDVHHHILFGVDDGPKTLEETLAMLKLSYMEGTRHIIATPHFDPLGSCPDLCVLTSQTGELNALCFEKFPGLSISLGAEVFFGEGVRRRLRAGIIPTLAGSDHVLVEFPPGVDRGTLENGVRHLANGGFVTILSHIERYQALIKDSAFARYLKEKYGTLLQVNAETFLLPQRLSVRRFLKRAVPDGLVDFVASDAHGAQRRKTRLLEAYGKTAALYGEPLAISLFQGRACAIYSRNT